MTPQSALDQISRLLKTISSIGALVYILVCGFIIFSRVSYPLEIECLEGTTLQHTEAAISGRQIYTAPSAEFVPSIYTPLYYYLAAPFYFLFGKSIFALRLFSLLASIISVLYLYFICRHISLSQYYAFIACGLFIAAYAIYGSWLDLARVDTLALLFTLAGIYYFFRSETARGDILPGALLALSFFTKQSALPVIFLLIFMRIVTWSGSKRFALGAASLIPIASISFFIESISGGWFSYYVFRLPSMHPINQDMLLSFWSQDLFANFPILILFIAAALLYRLLRKSYTFSDMIVPALSMALILSAYPGRIKNGGYVNLLLPAVTGIIIIFIWLAIKLRSGSVKPAVTDILFSLAVIIQLIIMKYPVKQLIPTDKQWTQAAACKQKMASLSGNIFWAEHLGYTTQQSRQYQASQPAVYDLVHSADSVRSAELLRRIITNFRLGKYDWVILDANSEYLTPVKLLGNYVLSDSAFFQSDLFTISGTGRVPKFAFTKKR